MLQQEIRRQLSNEPDFDAVDGSVPLGCADRDCDTCFCRPICRYAYKVDGAARPRAGTSERSRDGHDGSGPVKAGICADCANFGKCSLAVMEGGIWNCEDYS